MQTMVVIYFRRKLCHVPNTSKDPLNGLMMNLLLFFADLSRNKLTELPPECTDYCSLERLVLYHNAIRSIPDSIVYLQSLQFLDLSRNQLSYLPVSICELPLQVCNHPLFLLAYHQWSWCPLFITVTRLHQTSFEVSPSLFEFLMAKRMPKHITNRLIFF